jgi:Fe-S-cluster containining protein
VRLPIACDGCGACCETQGLPPGYSAPALIHHLPPPLRNQLLVELAIERRTRVRREGVPCLWFDQDTRRCRHYEHRPPVCRRFEAGGDGCNQWRRGAGYAPLERANDDAVRSEDADLRMRLSD